MAKRPTVPRNSLGLVEKPRADLFSIRLSGEDSRKLEKLAKGLKVGKSAMARLIVEKFIAEHDPDRRGGR
jgi:hypothetical protein